MFHHSKCSFVWEKLAKAFSDMFKYKYKDNLYLYNYKTKKK